MRQMEKEKKWSRREEQNFYRTVATFGVDTSAWDRFRELAQLDKKMDETLSDYLAAFLHMCQKVCGRLGAEADAQLPGHLLDMQVEVVSEERAARCLQRVELMGKVRVDVLGSGHFAAWMAKCAPSPELPDWWVHCQHDVELVKAAARYGM